MPSSAICMIQGIRLNIASNGYSLTVMPESILKMFSDVEVSIDYPTEAEQDTQRGPGNWALVHQAIERCHQLGMEVSILSTLMCTNFDKMDRMVASPARMAVICGSMPTRQ